MLLLLERAAAICVEDRVPDASMVKPSKKIP